MSIVAWNGKMLAADRMGVTAEMRVVSPKLVDIGDGIAIAWTGKADQGLILLQWWRDGCDANAWPAFQQGQEWSRLIIASKGRCFYYERNPMEQEVFLPFCAWGIGRDFAMGAMEMGANPQQAIEVASKWSIGCGFGVDCADVGAGHV